MPYQNNFKTDPNSLSFVQNSLQAAKNNPGLLPASFDAAGFESDVKLDGLLNEDITGETGAAPHLFCQLWLNRFLGASSNNSCASASNAGILAANGLWLKLRWRFISADLAAFSPGNQ